MATVDAKYASTYNFAMEASSLVKTKIVPVPPPNIFEETIRAKVQQRKEWEERMLLLDQVKAILPSLKNSVDSITVPSITATSKLQEANELKDEVSLLNEEYDKLTTDHWTVIKSVQLRAAADNTLETVVEKINQLLLSFPKDTENIDSSAVDAAKQLVIDIQSNLITFKEKIAEIIKFLPLTEKEKAEQEASKEETPSPDGGEQ